MSKVIEKLVFGILSYTLGCRSSEITPDTPLKLLGDMRVPAVWPKVRVATTLLRYGIELDDDTINGFETAGDIVNYLSKRVGEEAPAPLRPAPATPQEVCGLNPGEVKRHVGHYLDPALVRIVDQDHPDGPLIVCARHRLYGDTRKPFDGLTDDAKQEWLKLGEMAVDVLVDRLCVLASSYHEGELRRLAQVSKSAGRD